jgi:hypothetical protein
MFSHMNCSGGGPVYIGGTGMNHIPFNASNGPMPKPGDIITIVEPSGGLLGAIIGGVLGGPLGVVAGGLLGGVAVPSRGHALMVGSNMEALPVPTETLLNVGTTSPAKGA